MRFALVTNVVVAAGCVLLYLELAAFAASEPAGRPWFMDWPVGLVMSMACAVLAFFFARELLRDRRGY